jgi:hypothetical protein
MINLTHMIFILNSILMFYVIEMNKIRSHLHNFFRIFKLT